MSVRRMHVQVTLQLVVIVTAVTLLIIMLLAACTSSGHPIFTPSVGSTSRSSTTSTPSPNLPRVLPNHALTPGALNPAVTQATIHQTICVRGWTAIVRPPVTYTEPLKRKQLHSGYTWHGDTKLSDYEEDHLIPLELGGSPTSVQNLWPEPHLGGSFLKDMLENTLKKDVCATHNPLPLATARNVIATDWSAAYDHYVEGQ